MRRTVRYMRRGISDDILAYKRGKKRTLRYCLNSRTFEVKNKVYGTIRLWVGIADCIGPFYSPHYGTRAYAVSTRSASEARQRARNKLSDNLARRGYIGLLRLSNVDAADEIMRPCAGLV